MTASRGSTGIPVRGPRDLPVSRRAILALPLAWESPGGTGAVVCEGPPQRGRQGSTGKMPVRLMGKMPMLLMGEMPVLRGMPVLLLMALAAFALLAACAVSASAGADDESLARWPSVAAVRLGTGTPPAKALVEFALTPEAISKAQPGQGDLRLTDVAGKIVPYVKRVDRGSSTPALVQEPARMYNPVYVPGKSSSVTVDFGAAKPRTQIEVFTPGQNFRRRVMVEAGSDGQSWQVLRKGDWLFNVAHENGQYAKTRVALPDNDFRYLRVTVFQAPDDPDDLPIEKVQSRFDKNTPPELAEVEIIRGSMTITENPKLKATEIEVDLGFEKLPLHDVVLGVADEQFLRRVEVLGRNHKTIIIEQPVENAPPRKQQVEEPWRSLGGGAIHRFDSAGGQEPSANLSVPLSGGCRYIKLRIYNGDDAPLTRGSPILKVYRLQQYVAFQAKGAGPYKLYLGNAKAATPQYDLAHFADRLRGEGVTKATLDAVAPNPSYAQPVKTIPWSERHKGIIWGAMLFLGLVLVLMVRRQFRHARPSQRQEQ